MIPKRYPVFVRVRFTRDITLGTLAFVKGETWDARRERIQPDGTLIVGGAPCPPNYYVEIARWHTRLPAPD